MTYLPHQVIEDCHLHNHQHQERINSGTSWTNNEQFDKDGYIVVKDLWDPKELFVPVPEMRGQINYWGKREDQYNHIPLEGQVEGSLACYTRPQYNSIHSGISIWSFNTKWPTLLKISADVNTNRYFTSRSVGMKC